MINMLFNGVPANIMALAGLVFAFIMTCLLLVKCNDRRQRIREESSAVNGALSAGKPRGAGFIFILVFIVSVVLFCELNTEIIIYLVLLAAAMMTGFLDDCSRAPWGELKKGLLDFVIAVMDCITFLNFNSNVVAVCDLRRQYHDPSGDLRYSDRCSCMGIHQCDKLQ